MRVETNRHKELNDPYECTNCHQVFPLGEFAKKEEYYPGGGPGYYYYNDFVVCPACVHEEQIGNHIDYDFHDQ